MKALGRIGAGLPLCAGLCALWLGAAPPASAGKPLRGGTKVALLHDTHGKGRAGGGRGSAKKKRVRYRPPEMPKQLDLVSVDLEVGVVQVDVMGVARPPESRLFVLTDERARRFVPQSSACAPSGAGESAPLHLESGKELAADASAPPRTWRCALVLPRLYRRAALTGLSMEWGDKQVSAPSDRVHARWAEARAVTPLDRIGIGSPGSGETQTEIAPLPSAAPPSLPAEGSPAIDADTLDEGAEEEEN